MYHELIQKKLSMKANSQNIFMKQITSSAIIDCVSSIEQTLPNVQRIVNLFRQILEPAAAELFKMHVHLISSSYKAKKEWYQEQFPNRLIPGTILPQTFDGFHGFNVRNDKHCIIHDECGNDKIGKMPLWVIALCCDRCSTKLKQYQIQRQSSFSVLAKSCDDAWLIEGFLNHLSVPEDGPCRNATIPMNPVMDVVHRDELGDCSIPTVVLFIPSCGIFYSPYFYCKTPRIAAMGKVLGNQTMCTSFSLEQLPATALRICRRDGLCAKGGFLSSFSKLFRIIVRDPQVSVDAQLPVHTCHHLPDKQLMVYPDFDINHPHGKVPEGMTRLEYLEKRYKVQLARSSSNKATNKQYVPKCFYRHPTQCAKVPLIIHAREIPIDHQVLLQTVIHKEISHVGVQTTTRLHCIRNSAEFSLAREYGLQLGRILAQRRGKYRVRDNPVTQKVCNTMKISFGFDGNMYVIGQHVNSYKKIDNCNGPVDYGGTHDVASLTSAFIEAMMPIIHRHFHYEWLCQRNYLMSRDENPPFYLGGRNAFTKTLNVTCNLANPAHYDPYDYGCGIVIWIMEGTEDADIEFVFPNLLVKNHDDEPTNTGVIYKLCDGAMMSWHGPTQRHCTSIRTPAGSVATDPNTSCMIPDLDVYGFHFVNLMPNIEVLPII